MWLVIGTLDTCIAILTFAFVLSVFLFIFNACLWHCSPFCSLHPPTLENWNWLWLLLFFGLFFEAACVLGTRHDEQSSQGTLYEALGCVMFVYRACLPPIILCVRALWLALLATMLGWADGNAYWLNGWIKGEVEKAPQWGWEGLDGGFRDVS